MSEYTSGPWVVLPEEVDRAYIRIRGTQLGGRYKIANVLTPFYDNVHEREAEETRCNAHLISAAPEMYEALAAFDKWWRLPTTERTIEAIEPAMRMCIEAKAKAEGRKE